MPSPRAPPEGGAKWQPSFSGSSIAATCRNATRTPEGGTRESRHFPTTRFLAFRPEWNPTANHATHPKARREAPTWRSSAPKVATTPGCLPPPKISLLLIVSRFARSRIGTRYPRSAPGPPRRHGGPDHHSLYSITPTDNTLKSERPAQELRAPTHSERGSTIG